MAKKLVSLWDKGPDAEAVAEWTYAMRNLDAKEARKVLDDEKNGIDADQPFIIRKDSRTTLMSKAPLLYLLEDSRSKSKFESQADMVKLLVKKGASLLPSDMVGLRPADIAIRSQNVEAAAQVIAATVMAEYKGGTPSRGKEYPLNRIFAVIAHVEERENVLDTFEEIHERVGDILLAQPKKVRDGLMKTQEFWVKPFRRPSQSALPRPGMKTLSLLNNFNAVAMTRGRYETEEEYRKAIHKYDLMAWESIREDVRAAAKRDAPFDKPKGPILSEDDFDFDWPPKPKDAPKKDDDGPDDDGGAGKGPWGRPPPGFFPK